MTARLYRLAGALAALAFSVSFPSASAPVPAPVLRSDAQQSAAIAALRAPADGNASASERARRTLLAASTVRSVEIEHGALVVDAPLLGDATMACRRYADLAAEGDRDTVRIVLTDLQNPAGAVAFCSATGRPAPPNKTPTAIVRVSADIAAQGLRPGHLEISGGEAWITYENRTYRREAEAVGRIVRVLMADLPPEVEIFHVIASPAGVPLTEVKVLRSAMERAARDPGTVTPVAIAPARMDIDPGFHDAGLSWWLRPELKHFFPGYGAPLVFAARANGGIAVEPLPGLTLATELSATLWTSALRRSDPPSELPRARTDFGQYLRHGQYGIEQMTASYRFRLAPDIVAEARGGLLEDMYMGVGGQIVWRPGGSRFAIGGDVYQVWKRDYDRLFGARGYQTVTGHLSIYYDAGDTRFALHAGRYLAGDNGATFEVTRRVWRGIEIGAWATLTDVPFSQYGHGSFDKGIMLRIPLETGFGRPSGFALRFHGIQRDGGQRLEDDDALARDPAAPGDVARDSDAVVEP